MKHIFAGHNTDEGFLFADPSVQNTSAFDEYLSSVAFPDATTEVLNIIVDKLYPPIFNESSTYGYNDTLSRLATLTSDHSIVCNPYFLLEAFGPECSHAYLFDIGPGFHAEDNSYTFYDDAPSEDGFNIPVNGTVALALQTWILNFVATGNPNGVEAPHIPTYGANRTVGLLSKKGLGLVVSDPAGLQRCQFWQDALYF